MRQGNACIDYFLEGEMMRIHTRYHGEQNIEEEKILTFENGIPGFPEEKRFVLLPLTEDQVFLAMQSVKTPELAFVVVNPFFFFQDYEFCLDEGTIAQLGIEDRNDVRVLNILTIRDPFRETTINLKAPLVLNEKTRKGKQVILEEEKYLTRHPLFLGNPSGAKG